MRKRNGFGLIAILGVGGFLGWLTADGLRAPAQDAETAGAPVSRGSTVLPRPEPQFRGKIGRTVKDSVPDFPKEVRAPEGCAERPVDTDR